MRLPASLLCFASLLAHTYCEDVFGIVGETFTFPVEINQKISEIIWKKSKDKVAVWDGQSTPTYFTSLRNRSILKENGCLTIFNLEKSDAGAYELDYWDSKMDHYLYFELIVLDPPAEPKIGCSIRGDNLVLNCTSDFPRPLNYTWKFRKNPLTYHSQEISIPIENDDTENATCLIAFSQTEKSSEISLIQCFPDKKGDSSDKRSRYLLIAAFVLFLVVVLLVFLYIRGRAKSGREIVQKKSPMHGSGEHEQLFPGESREQHNVDREIFSQAVPCESEKPEADRELSKEDSAALKDEQTVNNSVNQEELSAMQKSTLTPNCEVDHGATEEVISNEKTGLLTHHGDDCSINEGQMTQDAEDGRGEHLNNSPICSNEGLKS